MTTYILYIHIVVNIEVHIVDKRFSGRYPRVIGNDRGHDPEVLEKWWARQDSNRQPDRYDQSALTIELRGHRRLIGLMCGPDDG